MEKTFNPGKFNKRISFLKHTQGYDEYGEPSDTWPEFKKGWAKKLDLIGTDFYASQTSDTKIEVKFNCRYVAGITKEMRLQKGTEVYEIVGVPIDIDDLHRELLIYCKLVVQ